MLQTSIMLGPRAEGEAWDIADAIPLLYEMQIAATADYGDLRGSDASSSQRGRQSSAVRAAWISSAPMPASRPTSSVRSIRVVPDAAVILVSNPVDVLTRIALDTSTRPAHGILGSGTVLDGARLRHRPGRLLDVVEDEDVHAYVIGEHGDSSFPVWSSATGNSVHTSYP